MLVGMVEHVPIMFSRVCTNMTCKYVWAYVYHHIYCITAKTLISEEIYKQIEATHTLFW